MKKLIISALAMSMLLTACRVGPEEQPKESLTEPPQTVSNEPSETELPTETSSVSEQTQVTETVPPQSTETEETAPVETSEPDETEPLKDIADIEIVETHVDVMYPVMSLNVRTGPSTDYESIGYVAEGQAVEILGYAPEYGWYVVDYYGVQGFVSGLYMSEINPNPVTTEESDDAEAAALPAALAESMREAYAMTLGLNADDVTIVKSYGDFENGTAVAIIYPTDAEISDEEGLLAIGDYEFLLPSESYDLIYYYDSGIISLYDAYHSGLVTDAELGRLDYYRYLSSSDYPAVAPLDGATQEKICADYKIYKGITDAEPYILRYYCTVSSGEIVTMWLSDSEGSLPVTDDMKYFNAGPYRFELSSGSYEIELHTADGGFITLYNAYLSGLLSSEDLRSAYYYSRHPS